jgi:serine/threonine protein phosphatase 1
MNGNREDGRFFIVGDIHAMEDKLTALLSLIEPQLTPGDTVIFLGDYIDRGQSAYQTVQTLVELSTRVPCVFLMGNHEILLRDFLDGRIEKDLYYFNGGGHTIASYRREFGGFFIPESHRKVLFSERYYYEGRSFIAVHAGIPPYAAGDLASADPAELVWIRDAFFRSEMVWDKTVIHGHTPTHYLGVEFGSPSHDHARNIIDIDTAAIYGGKLTCLIWPDQQYLQV